MSYKLINAFCEPTRFIARDCNTINMEWTDKKKSMTDPTVFGPAVWFTLHNGSAHLPRDISPVSLNRIKMFIDGIPDMLVVCGKCAEHARMYIETHRDAINAMKSGDDVFKFYVDFHNFVNERLGKAVMTYDTARKLYMGGYAKVLKY